MRAAEAVYMRVAEEKEAFGALTKIMRAGVMRGTERRRGRGRAEEDRRVEVMKAAWSGEKGRRA